MALLVLVLFASLIANGSGRSTSPALFDYSFDKSDQDIRWVGQR